MRNWIASFGSAWRNLRASDKGWFAAAVVLLVLLGAGEMVLHHGTPDVAVLFGDLGAQDENAVVGYLRANKVPFGVNGKSLFVRRDMADSLRAQIAEKQILKIGLTDKIQDINVVHAIEGEIAKTLRSVSFVQEASVHISPGSKSLYSKNETPTKASVLLKLREGCQPTVNQINTIGQFVSGAYSDLKPERVLVTDQDGNVLNQPRGEGTPRPQCIFGGR